MAVTGETAMFWEDLSTARMISETIAGQASMCCLSSTITGVALKNYLPLAKISQGNYVYVYSNNDVNYFGVSSVLSIGNSDWQLSSNPGLTVQQAFQIDQKVDDGFPQAGRVLAVYINQPAYTGPVWVSSGGQAGGAYTTATSGSAVTCYDNSNVVGATQQYSVQFSNGANDNCALSFQFQ